MAVSIFPCGFDIPCDGYACHRPAKWFIGEYRNHFIVAKLCEDCISAVIDGLKQHGLIREPEPEPEPELKLEPPAEPGGVVYTCRVCGAGFESSQKLAAHVRYQHNA